MSSHSCNHGSVASSSVYQTIEEMDFERGIWFAAQNDDLERLKKLLEQGIHVDCEDSAGYTALHYSARAGYTRICQYLLDAGAAANATTRAGHATALHRASSVGRLDVVRLLLAAGAKCDLQDADGKTALHRAAEKGDINVAKLLLEAGPHLVHIADNKGNLPWQLVVGYSELQVLLHPK